MKKKSVFRKIAFLLTMTILIQMLSFSSLTLRVKAADQTLSVDTVLTGDTTVEGNLTVPEGITLTVQSGATLTVNNGDFILYGNLVNYGTININGSGATGDIELHQNFTAINHEGARIISYSKFGGDTNINNDIQNYGYIDIYCGEITSHIRNYGNGKLVSRGLLYKLSNIDYSVENGVPSQVISNAYIPSSEGSSVVLKATGYKFSTSINYSEAEDSVPLLGYQRTRQYYVFDSSGNRSYEMITLPNYYVKNVGANPTGDKCVIEGNKEPTANYYKEEVKFFAPDGYSELQLGYNEVVIRTGNPVIVNEEGTYRGVRVRLKDADNQWTEWFSMPDFDLIEQSTPYRIDGAYVVENGHKVYANKATIKPFGNYSLLLADEYNRLTSSEVEFEGKNEIDITQTSNNIQIYVHSNSQDFWVGPISVADISVGLPIPATKYTISGKKIKDNYYESDVDIIAPEGYKISTSKEGELKDKITLTKTTKGVVVYLAKDYPSPPAGSALPSGNHYYGKLYSEPYTIGDIYILREGEGKVNVNDLYYGGKVIPTVETKTNDVKKVTYKYKNASGGDYLKEAPTEVGKYIVEATFEQTENYKKLVVKDEFEIMYLPTPAAPYSLEGTKGDNEFYTTDVKIIPAEGYQISKTIKTGYVDSIVVNMNDDIGYVYLRKISTGEMTDKIAIKEILIDKDEPVITGITDKEVIYTDSKQVIVKDDNLFEVVVNGVKVAVSNGQAVIDLSADNGIMDYTIVMTDKAGNTTTIFVTLITAWMQSGDVQEGVPLKLYTGYTYNFPEGSTWTIEGDPTVYKGGNKFVVTNNVEIKFKKN